MEDKNQKTLQHSDNKSEIALYQLDNTIEIKVKIENNTVWLTQAQMVILFQSTKQNISLHINNVYKENELDYTATVKEYLTVRKIPTVLTTVFCLLIMSFTTSAHHSKIWERNYLLFQK